MQLLLKNFVTCIRLIRLMSGLKGRETIEVKTKVELWNWLEKHHAQDKGVWVVHYKKSSGLGDMSWESLVDVCLCFGWIDSTAGKVDELRTKRYIAPRKPKSGWSKKNKLSIERLLAEGRVQPAGLQAIERAKSNGSWGLSDKAEDLSYDDDLLKAFAASPGSRDKFRALPARSQKITLQWIYQAKTDVTRKSRIKQTVEAAIEGKAARTA